VLQERKNPPNDSRQRYVISPGKGAVRKGKKSATGDDRVFFVEDACEKGKRKLSIVRKKNDFVEKTRSTQTAANAKGDP